MSDNQKLNISGSCKMYIILGP